MAKSSRDKGKRGEREIVDLLNAYGIKARRGQQFKGGNESPDVVSEVKWMHIEVKRRESTDIHKWMEVASSECDDNKMPVVFHKKNNTKWLVTMHAGHFAVLLKTLRTIGEMYEIQISFKNMQQGNNPHPPSDANGAAANG